LQDSFRLDTERYVLCTLLRYRAQRGSKKLLASPLPPFVKGG
jgi:hypothetical protein